VFLGLVHPNLVRVSRWFVLKEGLFFEVKWFFFLGAFCLMLPLTTTAIIIPTIIPIITTAMMMIIIINTGKEMPMD